MEIKNNETKEAFTSDLRDAPFTKIKPEGDITYEEAKAVIDNFCRPPFGEHSRDTGKPLFPEQSEPIFEGAEDILNRHPGPLHDEFPQDRKMPEFPEFPKTPDLPRPREPREEPRYMAETGGEATKKKFEEDKEAESNIKRIPTRNQDLEGKEHPETGVPFEKKIVKNDKGEDVEVVVPKFESKFDAQLPENLEKASDKEQNEECNKQLKEAVENDPDMKEQFTDEQLEQIMDGETPDGYTWHHDAEKGKMQLVDSETHAKTGHTGGRVIWGGGQSNR